MPTEEPPEIINLPPSFRATTRGKKVRKTRYSIEVKSDPLAIKVAAYGLSKGPAEALQQAFFRLILKAESEDVATTSQARRDKWVDQYNRGNSAAQFRFMSPRKKDGTIRKGGRPDTPPVKGKEGFFNHSGRLREGIALRWNRRELSWRINAPANRLHRESFGDGFEAFLAKFESKVNPQLATQDARFQAAFNDAVGSTIEKLGNQLTAKKAALRAQQLGLLRAFVRLGRAL